MKTLLLIFKLIFCTLFLNAQVDMLKSSLISNRVSEMNALNTQYNGTLALTDFSSRVGTERLFGNLRVDGSPYLTEDTATGYFYQNGTTIKTATRLNYYFKSFEFKHNDTVYYATSPTIDSVIVNNETYIYLLFKLSGERPSRKVVKIIDRIGRNVLYEYKSVNFIQETKPGPLVDYKPAHFEWNEPVYLFELKDKIIPLTSFKELIKSFPNREGEIKDFIKSNGITKDSFLGLIKLFNFISLKCNRGND